MELKNVLVFRDDLYFDGAVQADWFYSEKQLDAVASSFVFHGPSTHAVSKEDIGGQGLMDTASFALHLAEKMNDPENLSPFTMPIAGYGTGKSHLAVTLSALLSGEEFNPVLHEKILTNLSRADKSIANKIRPLVKNRHLVLTLNGMRDFNLHYELLRTAEKALRINHVHLDILAHLNRLKETALNFVNHSYSLLQEQFHTVAGKYNIFTRENDLLTYLINNLDEQSSTAFQIVNEVYTDFNGHPIRLDEGVSASDILDTLLQECCGLHGQFDGIVILFDEFGRYLEYVSSNPVAAGDSALQQIFESVQNADGDIQFVSFIQSDIKSYLQRVDKTSNISRYIDRYDAGEKIYLSSNLETIFANLLDHPDEKAFNQNVAARLNASSEKWRSLHSNIQKWLPLHGIWNNASDFQRIIVQEIYPLHPLSTYLLCSLTDWLQSRSSLTLLSEKVREISDTELSNDRDLPLIYPVELLKGSFFNELLSAEEQGRQRSQFCILLNNIFRRFDTKLNQAERNLLFANLILRICRFHFQSKSELCEALHYCTGLSSDIIQAALNTLENEYAVLSYDDRLVCYDFVADSVGATDFRNYIRSAKMKVAFSASMLNQSDILDYADISRIVETDFGASHGIQTREWSFKQRIEPINNIDSGFVHDCVSQLRAATLPNMEKGLLVWVYASKETPSSQIDHLQTVVSKIPSTYAIRMMMLDDADNALQDVILEYRVLFDMPQSERSRYQRFYDAALEKAAERIRLQFSDLKAERKVVTEVGISPSPKRLKAYLTDVFEQVYPLAVPFDFEGFDVKTASGNGYKNYFSIMRWILMDHMNFQILKAQTTDVRNRVESVMGQNGLYSWKALTKDFKGTKPMQKAANAVYSYLEERLNNDHIISFDQIIDQWTQAPYGMNEYSVFMMVGLFCEVYSFTSKLELEDSRYSTDAWAELVIKDKRYDTKLFAKTKLRLIDITETLGQYRRLFQTISSNSDLQQVAVLAGKLTELTNEESVPEALQSDYALARMRIDEGLRSLRFYNDKMNLFHADIEAFSHNKNAYNALKTCKDVSLLMMNPPGNGVYSYNPDQIEEMKECVALCKANAESAFKDGWIKSQTCSSIENLSGFRSFSKKVIDLFEYFAYSNEADEMKSQVEAEVDRIKLLMEQQSLLSDCKAFLDSSTIERGLTMKNLEALQERGNKLLKVFDTFDYESDRRFRFSHQDMLRRLEEIRSAMNQLKNELTQAWDAIYGIETVDDAFRVRQQIAALLTCGLTDKDREDFESIDKFIGKFLTDVQILLDCKDDPDAIDAAYQTLSDHYSEEDELDFSTLIESTYEERLNKLKELDQRWYKQFLTIDLSTMDQHQLDQWKHDALPLPAFLSKETRLAAEALLQDIENALSKQRLEYILNLVSKLTPEEKVMLLKALSGK